MRLLRRALATLTAALILGAASGCGGGGDDQDGVAALLLLGDTRGIIEVDVEADTDRVLVAAPTTTTSLRDPAVSPDATKIVFTSTAAVRVAGGARETNADLWVANRDGSNARLLVAHAAPNTGFAAPLWVDDATVLAVSHSLADANVMANYPPRLMRVDATAGTAVEAVAGVRAFGLAPDGTHTVTVAADEKSLSVQDLASGADRLSIVAAGQFLYVVSPRYAPDGGTIAFVAFDAADYPPTDPDEEPVASLWRISPTGDGLTRVASFESDDRSSLAWSADGATVYVLTSHAVLQVDVASGNVEHLREEVTLLSMLDWEPAPPEEGEK